MEKPQNPKISVIMSVYNGTPYLKEAVDSILSQTYKNFEFIIVDDASSDNSWQYLKNLKDKRIKLIKNEKNLGLATSLNRALKIASGEYIARMDADDISLPQRFAQQLKFLQENPTIDLCGTWVDLIDDKGNVIGEKKRPTSPSKVKNAIGFYTALIHPTFMGKKTLFKALNGYSNKFDFAEDYDFLMRARDKFKMTNIPRKLLEWRLHDARRSRANMNIMDKVDLSIKLNSLKRNGLEIYLILGILKKMIFMYLIPSQIKFKLATMLKTA